MPDVPITPMSFDVTILTGMLAETSLAMYTRDFAAYLAFAGSEDAALNPATLARWRTILASSPYSPNTINRMLAAVRRILDEAAVQGYVSHELAGQFAHIKDVRVNALRNNLRKDNHTRLSPEMVAEIIDAIDTSTPIGLRNQALVHTAASSGLRAQELADVRQHDISARGKGYVIQTLGKGQSDWLEAYLSEIAYISIQTWLEERPITSEYVFTSFKGWHRPDAKPMTTQAIWETIRSCAEAAGYPHVKPHDIRRFVGTELAAKDIRKAQRALRHKSIETTARHYVLDDIEPGLTDHLY